jgi:8-oxo-dGTP diphosphatase
VKDCSLIYKICHHYPDKTINLSIYNIEDSLGAPLGKEGQEIAWSTIEQFNNYKLLPTMWKIIHKISLPKSYWITPNEHQTESTIDECRKHLISGTKLIQLRSKTLLDSAYIENIYKLCKEYKARLILNTPSKTYTEICDGWHLTSSELLSLKERPCDDSKLLGASTHNKLETTHAEKISADYISLSPVEATLSHPDAKTLGWDRSSNIIDQCNLPLFLLGGMNKELIGKALSIGAQGVAGIREI